MIPFSPHLFKGKRRRRPRRITFARFDDPFDFGAEVTKRLPEHLDVEVTVLPSEIRVTYGEDRDTITYNGDPEPHLVDSVVATVRQRTRLETPE